MSLSPRWMDRHVFWKFWERLEQITMQSLTCLILQLFSMYNLLWECPTEPSVWPSSYSACPLRNLPQPVPSHLCRLVSWPSGLQCCFGSLWEGLASRPSNFGDNAKAHSARMGTVVRCRGSCESLTITVDVLKGSKTVWLDARSIALYLRLTTYKYAFSIWYDMYEIIQNVICIYPDILHSTMACRVLAMNA